MALTWPSMAAQRLDLDTLGNGQHVGRTMAGKDNQEAGGEHSRGKGKLPAWHSGRNEFHNKTEKVTRQTGRKPMN